MQPRMILISLAAVALVSAAIPAGVADTTLVDLALGSAHSADFNDDATYSSSPVPPPPPRPAATSDWAWGAPTSGPGVAASGAKVWATNLSGNYRNSHCGGIMSPAIDLSGATSASASIAEWHHFELSSLTGTAWDAGVVFATTDGGMTFTQLTPASGHGTQTISTTARTCLDNMLSTGRGFTGPVGTTLPPATYATRTVDLGAFVGQSVRLVLAFGADGSGQRTGWYVDDFAVTIDGVTTTQDFEASDGGFTVVSTKAAPPAALGWEHGMAAVGPASDTPVWGTNLDGNYGPNECAWIESAPFAVGPLPNEANAVVKATLSWKQWYRGSSSAAAGVIQVGDGNGGYTIIAPESGYPAKPTSTILDACLGHLTPGLGAFAGLINTAGTPLVDYAADLTPFLGQTITLRFLFASTTSTATNEGWYVDDVNVDYKALVVAPDAEDLVPALAASTAPGWTIGGSKSTWAYGLTTTNPANQTVFKTNLNGNHDLNECSYIESAPVPGAVFAANPTLRFEHWHRIAGTGVNVPWVAGIVLVSGDAGATWQHVAMGDYVRPVYQAPSYTEVYDNCLAAFGADVAGGAYGLAKTDFYWSEADLSAYAASPTVQVRFAIASDGTFAYEGWAIRAVELGGVKLL